MSEAWARCAPSLARSCLADFLLPVLIPHMLISGGAVRSALDWDSWARERVEQPRTMAVAGKSGCIRLRRVALSYRMWSNLIYCMDRAVGQTALPQRNQSMSFQFDLFGIYAHLTLSRRVGQPQNRTKFEHASFCTVDKHLGSIYP